MSGQRINKHYCGWGINDVDYKVEIKEKLIDCNKSKLVWRCPYYEDWTNMIVRAHNVNYSNSRPSYSNVTICDDWKCLSNFIKWVDSQPNRDWQNCALDKDLLLDGNKYYSPENCVYIPKSINSFILSCKRSRGNLLIGVTFSCRKKNPYSAQCRNPFNRKCSYVGMFPTELEAHKAWQAKKHEYACALADLQDDPRVADALRQRYSADKDWTKR